MQRSFFIVVIGVVLLAIGAVGGLWLSEARVARQTPASYSVLDEALEAATREYADPVSRGQLTEYAIEGLLNPLDPHSVYIDADRMQAVQEQFNASFEGIGVTYELIPAPEGRDTILVLTVIPGGPSARAGVQAGDRIVAIDDTNAVGWSHEKIQRRLKGPEGSTVRVALQRPGRSERVQTAITRDDVPLRTVDASYMLDGRTGYIKINRFAQTTYREFQSSLRTLDERGMQRLILDLRGNAGGYMQMAERVADEFLKEGQVIVSARSRHSEYTSTREATRGGAFEDRPLTVLVDEHSASASEIVAGALQDHDRALIIGRRTYGKGLVQREFQLGDGSALRVTIARFYTPTGRLIQTNYEGSRRDYYERKSQRFSGDTLATRAALVTATPDSLQYRTDAGRIVVGGGGIVPDQLVPADSFRHPFVTSAVRSGALREYARRWVDNHAGELRADWGSNREAFAQAYVVPDSAVAAAMQFLRSSGITESETPVNEVRQTLAVLLKSYAGRRLHGIEMWIRVRNDIDPAVQKARRSWGDAELLASKYPIEPAP